MRRTAANRQFKVEFLSFFRNFLRNSLELSFVCRTLAVFCFLAVVATYLKVFIILKYIIITNQANQALIFYSSNICALYYISGFFH